MTTLAIVGGGIVGRSLLYNLTAQHFPVDEVLLFDSGSFAHPCSLNSSAVVALRGVERGHSPLGDLLVQGHECFAAHFVKDAPAGVYPVRQYIGGQYDLDRLRSRHPGGQMTKSVGGIGLKRESYVTEEDAYLVDPPVYLDWLLRESQKKIEVTQVNDFVVDYHEAPDKITVRTHTGGELKVDHLVFATGATSRFWARRFPESLLSSSRPVQGAFLKFSGVNWDLPAFSLTYDGHNLVYRKEKAELLLGSTTSDHSHELPALTKLHSMYQYVEENLDVPLPAMGESEVVVGIREKAKKRAPYLFTKGRVTFLGGLYKNGFILSLKMTRSLVHQFHGHF